MGFSEKVASISNVTLEFIKGYMSSGAPFFAYVMMVPSPDAPRKQTIGLSIPRNSVILYSDYGHEVPEDVEEYVFSEFYKLRADREW